MDRTTIALSILASLIVPQSNSIPITQTTYNERKLFNNPYIYNQTIPLDGTPADIRVNFKTGDVYFTLLNPKSAMSLKLLKPNGRVESIETPGIGQSTAVDNYNDKVYFATDTGVVKYDKKDGSQTTVTDGNEDVTYISVANKGTVLYVATWPQNRVHKITIEDDKTNLKSFPYIPNGHGLTVDAKNNIYFSASQTTYILQDGDRTPIKIVGLPTGVKFVVFVSNHGDVYAMNEYSDIYKINAENASADRIGSFGIEEVNAFAMDASDNVIIGVDGALLMYKK